ncbi:hypothetical protein niasHS_000945 [Heterodera schachtii]|uniref:Globin family profile domain-containing protein n=1 Tax=Heterodera schachtii TaxID=97005 RepID=A0ABD2K7S9_HETSC
MGNHHAANGSPTSGSPSSSTRHLEAVVRKSAMSKNARIKLAQLREQQRRKSVAIAMERKIEPHKNCRSFTFGQSPFNSMDTQSDEQCGGSSSTDAILEYKKSLEPPRIEINGTIENYAGSTDNFSRLNAQNSEINDQRRGSSTSIGFSKHKAHKVDSRKITHKKRLERGQTTTTVSEDKALTAAERAPALKFFQRANGSKFAHSLDRYNADVCAEMRPLSLRSAAVAAARSMSPLLHQQRRLFSIGGGASGGTHRSRGSASGMAGIGEEDVLSWEQSVAVQRSWRRANQRIAQFGISADRCFAFYAFDRIFERAPELKPLFGISPSFVLTDLDEQQQPMYHPFMRHLHVFNNILDLTVRNAAELKSEILPALFTYGQRHYLPKLKDEFSERTVRLFCSQLVATMCDLLGDDFSPGELEAWIEMVTYMGRALLSGFEYERLQNGRKRSTQRF